MKHFEYEIAAWAEKQPAIRAIIVCGSRARHTLPADEWADLDLEVYVTDLSEFVSGSDWLHQFGNVWVHLQLEEEGYPVFLVLYENAEKVDFHFRPKDKLQRLADAPHLPDVYARGYYFLVDKDGWAARLPPPTGAPPPYQPPSESAFRFTVDAFWYGAVYVAKQIRRRNLWVVKFQDWTMKESLLQMMEWHAHAKCQEPYETWNHGHWLSTWTDAQTWQALHAAFGRFDAVDSWQALRTTMGLFHRLAVETAAKLGFAYATELDDNVTAHVERLYEQDDLSK